MRPLLLIALSLAPLSATAQGDVQAAASAFSEGQRAQLRHDWARAAELFEIADRASPSPEALRSAIRSHQAAGHDARAATLALRAIERYPEDRSMRSWAQRRVRGYSRSLGRLTVTCSVPCTMTLDGGVVETSAISGTDQFVEPGSHAIDATWPDRPARHETTEVAAGQTATVSIEAPAVQESEPEPAPEPAVVSEPEPEPLQTPAPAPRQPEPPEEERSGISPAVFWIGTALTVAAGGVLAWSGLDTLSKRDDYVAHPTREGYESGTDLELRTNLLIGGTALLGTLTLAIGIFATDWGGERETASLSPAIAATDHGFAFTLAGRL